MDSPVVYGRDAIVDQAVYGLDNDAVDHEAKEL